MPAPDVAIVLGTYNRLDLLKSAVSSIRRSVGVLEYVIVAVDGGSTDGTCEWLFEQSDIAPIYQKGQLTGAVAAFNLGFMYAVECGAPWVVILNDDDELIGPAPEIERAVEMMKADEGIGAVAFESNLRGSWAVEKWRDKPYCNKGVVRREAGMAAARAAGDPDGYCWWSRDHHTYASDTEMGLWIWRLGWRVVSGTGLRVHDNAPNGKGGDALRSANVARYTDKDTGTAKLFHARWGSKDAADYCRADAERFGGRLL